jgi:hypothetical protein
MYSACCSKLVKGLNILILMTVSRIMMANIHSTVFQYIADFEGITKAQLNFLIFAISSIFDRQILEYFYAA